MTVPRTRAGRELMTRLYPALHDLGSPIGRGWSVEEAIFDIEAEAAGTCEMLREAAIEVEREWSRLQPNESSPHLRNLRAALAAATVSA